VMVLVAVVGAFLATRLPARLIEPDAAELPLASDAIVANRGEGGVR
jgi:hypothetical protein